MSDADLKEVLSILVHLTDDERPSYYKIRNFVNFIFAFILLISLAWGTAMKLVVYNFYRNVKITERPINLYILVDLLFHHVIYLIYVSVYATLLMTGKPPIYLINNVFKLNIKPESFCFFYGQVAWFAFSQTSASNFGIAFYRLLCIQKTTWVKNTLGDKKLLAYISILTFILSGNLKFWF